MLTYNCAKTFRAHPEMLVRADALLWSINERLGSLCSALMAEHAGVDVTELSGDWMHDMQEIIKYDLDRAKKTRSDEDEY